MRGEWNVDIFDPTHISFNNFKCHLFVVKTKGMLLNQTQLGTFVWFYFLGEKGYSSSFNLKVFPLSENSVA